MSGTIPIQSLMTKEIFWDPLYAQSGGRLQQFCDWIDEYKKAVGWDETFGKDLHFHDLPIAMQIGVIFHYFGAHGAVLIDFNPSNMASWVDDVRGALLYQVSIHRCRICGCTDEDCSQCIKATGQACHWVEEDLCSRCEKDLKKNDTGKEAVVL